MAKDVESRIKTHNAGNGAKYTKPRLPVVLLWFKSFETKSEAAKEEYRIKRLSRAEKLNLINEIQDIPGSGPIP